MTHRYCEGEADCLSPEPTTHRVLVAECINEVLLTDATKAAGYVILDTACQRMCAGLHWSDAHVNKLKHWGLTTFQLPQQEFFEFGKGPTQQSDYALCFPASFWRTMLFASTMRTECQHTMPCESVMDDRCWSSH